MELTLAARKQITQAQLDPWPKATRGEKGAILDAIYAVTGWHRDHVRKAIRTALADQAVGGPRSHERRDPQPWHRPRLARALNLPLDQLDQSLAEPDDAVEPHTQIDPSGRKTQLGNQTIIDDARDATRFARAISVSGVNASTLDHLNFEVTRLAADYVIQPLSDVTVDIRDLWNEVTGLLENNRRPDQLRQLYMEVSRLGGLQGHVCLDLGHYRAATSVRTYSVLVRGAGRSQRHVRVGPRTTEPRRVLGWLTDRGRTVRRRWRAL